MVITELGAVRGTRTGDAYAYLGIPYAAPPVGPLRWKPTEPGHPWRGVREANEFGAECVQEGFDGSYTGGSEDCLTLNVWTPAGAKAEPIPVLVYIHGGYNINGSASKGLRGEHLYDGRYVAEHGPAVVVTLQYRLGNLGFLAHRALAAETPGRNVGNFGLLDQIAALDWVRGNIRRFGGDPARVLVHGYSAGSIDTCSMVVTPLARGLFSGAAMHSWPCVARSRADQERDGDAYAAKLGCDGAADVAACMRGKPLAEVVAAGGFGPGGIAHGATIDGYVIPGDPFEMLAAGKHNHVPLVIGTTSAEFETLLAHSPHADVHTEAAYRAAVHRMYADGEAELILAQYPSAVYGSPREALMALLSDRSVVCPSRRVARAAAAGQSEPVRMYVFTHASSTPQYRATPHGHGVDVAYYFHTLALGRYAPTRAELALSDAMIGYHLRFTATGDPNGGGAPFWPRYEADTDMALALDDEITAMRGFRAKECAFWDARAR